MRWTTTPPSGPGWYWHRPADTSGPPRVVRVVAEPMGLVVQWLDGEGSQTLRTVAAIDQAPGEWAGPIPEPTDP